MIANLVITAWKEPAIRASLVGQDLTTMPRNPAGPSPFDSDPANCAVGLMPATIRTIGSVTTILSCSLACSGTMWDGSCDVFTYGCC